MSISEFDLQTRELGIAYFCAETQEFLRVYKRSVECLLGLFAQDSIDRELFYILYSKLSTLLYGYFHSKELFEIDY